MKILSLFLIIVVALSCSHFKGRTPSGDTNEKPIHLVITVHGLSGNEKTFGSFNEVTKKYLTELNPNYEVHSVNFIYPTGQDEKKGTYNFAMDPQGLGAFIKSNFKNKLPGPKDKISLVGHSQGGLVSYMWFFNTVANQTSDYEYAKHVDSIITLGTPFWGSKIASILTDERNPDIIPLIKLFADLFAPDFKMTRHEISDLAYGSDTVNALRTVAIKMDTDPKIAAELEKLPVRFINITGVLPEKETSLFAKGGKAKSLVSGTMKEIIEKVYKIFTKSYGVGKGGNKRVESDIAVPVASSRWNFLYTTPKVIKEDTTISSAEYKDFSHFLKFSEDHSSVDKKRTRVLYTESAHLPFDLENTLSMAYIPKNCLEVETCEHPTYRYVIEHLANCKTNPECNQNAYQNIVQNLKVKNLKEHEAFKTIQASLESFAVQINIRLKPNTINQFPLKYFKKKYSKDNNNDFDQWQFDEYSLQGSVIDLKTDKNTQISLASTQGNQIVLGDRDEKHSVDIVSKDATAEDPVDHLRINITGRIEDANLNPDKIHVAPIEIKLPGLPTVKINNAVRAGMSTFTELDFTQ